MAQLSSVFARTQHHRSAFSIEPLHPHFLRDTKRCGHVRLEAHLHAIVFSSAAALRLTHLYNAQNMNVTRGYSNNC